MKLFGRYYDCQDIDKFHPGTTELTRSFGWKSVDAFMQHDVQEFNRVLQDALEVKMKVVTDIGISYQGSITLSLSNARILQRMVLLKSYFSAR